MTAQMFSLESDTPRAMVIVAYGDPQPKGSKTAMMIDGRPVLVEGSSSAGRRKLKLWQASVEASAAVRVDKVIIEEPVDVTMAFHLAPVESDRYRTRHAVKPDLDKLVRSVADSLTKAGVWKDDSLMCDVSASKRYAQQGEEPGVTITIVCRGDAEAADRYALRERMRRR
jgi:Holliday junction resolvase RusA-like endonuclease